MATQTIFTKVLAGLAVLVAMAGPSAQADDAKKQARNGYSLGIGPAALTNMSAPGTAFWANGAATFDIGQMLFRIGADYVGNGGAFLVDGSLGGQWSFQLSVVTPFAGLDLGYGVAKTDSSSLSAGTTIGGFVLGFGGGVQFMRTSTVSLEVGLRYALVLASPNPGFFGLRVSMNF